MLCNQCGSENPASNRFCGQCGAKFIGTSEPATATASPVAGSISSAFRQEVERQHAKLEEMRQPAADTIHPNKTVSVHAGTAATLTSQVGGFESVAPKQDDPPPAPPDDPPISGPSFLGLGDPTTSGNLEYLYDEEARSSGHARVWIALLISVAFAAFIAYEWRQNPSWTTTIVGRVRARAAGQSNTAANTKDVAPQAPQSADQNAKANPSSAAETKPPENTAVEHSPSSAAIQQPAEAKPDQSPANSASAEHPASASGHNESVSPAKANGLPTNAAAENSYSPQPAKKDDEPATRRARIGKRPAIEQRDPDADLVKRADTYLYGRGAPKSCSQALVYLRTAANHGNADARSKLGGLYATGHCVPLDRAEAYNWFTLARKSGKADVWVERNREMLWSQMTPGEKSRTLSASR